MSDTRRSISRKPMPPAAPASNSQPSRAQSSDRSRERSLSNPPYTSRREPFYRHNSFLWTQDESDNGEGSETECEQSKEDLQLKVSRLTENVSALQNQVTHLATQLARRSQQRPLSMISLGALKEKKTQAENTFTTSLGEDSKLNPLGPSFDYKDWIQNLMAIDSTNGEKSTQRSLSVAFHNLGVYGLTSPTNYQKDVYSSLLALGNVARRLAGSQASRIKILSGFDGHIRKGEMLLVLGRPGSGCSTFLKTISGEMKGLNADASTYLNYQGISSNQMRCQFRGEAIYTAEQDVHFPQLTVAQTLAFAARARVPRNRIAGVSREQYAEHMKDVVMAIFGLTNCAHTKVGNDFIRGVSGGERKRVSIAEATLNGSPLQSWDNSTRGLDASNAINFCKNLRIQSDLFSRTACVAIYQAPEAAYNLFDKVTVLYEGHQIYFGRAKDAKRYFTDMGFVCRERETTSDFLTSLTNPEERIVREGFEHLVPQTPDEFVAVWKKSSIYGRLMHSIRAYDARYPIGGQSGEKFGELRKAEQAKRQRTTSPYIISVPMQIRLCLSRGYARLRADTSLLITAILAQTILALIVGSVFYNMQPTTSSLFSRSALLFYATLLNALTTQIDVLTIYAQRPIIEKHTRYALYHPFSESAAAIICDFPSKFLVSFVFNLTLYFLTNLRREPGAFFTFILFSFTTTQTMSMMFRTVASMSKSIAQALAPSAILTLGLCLYTGFPIPVTAMPGWSRWLNYINPLAYVFESLMVNEMSGRDFQCSQFIPSGPGFQTPGPNTICSTVGSVPGKAAVAGDDYLEETFQYFPSHLWRNFAIVLAFLLVFCAAHLLAAEYITEEGSKGEMLVFRRNDKSSDVYGKLDARAPGSPMPTNLTRHVSSTTKNETAYIQKHKSVVHWQDICYEITAGKEKKHILDHVDGWIKPGTCTALMGSSGAGKTTLLDVIASRIRTGVVTGDILVNGIPRDTSFQRNCGYVQQSDLHLSSCTVREALRFSAVLRQPSRIPLRERVAYVDEVLKLLDMELYANAVIGVPGEGLNVEQRKRLTIAIELVAKPQLLILLDEPTSGLDSQTAWSIMNLLDKLKRHGQAVLCTIHQPSATIFQRFDRLLLLAKGKTVYFGEIGQDSSTMVQYFEENGSGPCPPDTNPAEWMLQVIGGTPGSKTTKDWTNVWRNSPNHQQVKRHLSELAEHLPGLNKSQNQQEPGQYDEYAASFPAQVVECVWRIFAHYWRTPSYIYSKLALSVVSALFIGFTFFRAQNSQQGVQNQILAVFMLMTIFSGFVSQILPKYVEQRNLFEARERPAKIFSWQAFMLSQMTAEIAWNSLVALLMFLVWYYPIGLYRNASTTTAVAERGGLMFLLIWAFMMFTSTFAFFINAGVPDAESASIIGDLLFSLSLTFCGVLSSPTALPGFWIFLYRVSPFTYLVSSMVSNAIGDTDVICSQVEQLRIPPPSGSTCQEYLGRYLADVGGSLQNPGSNSTCLVCPVSRTDSVIAEFGIFFEDRWRNLGLMFVYIVFNAGAALAIYWLARVPRTPSQKQTTAQSDAKKDMANPPPQQFSRSLSRRTSIGSGSSKLTMVSDNDKISLLPQTPNPHIRREDRSLPRTPYAPYAANHSPLPEKINAARNIQMPYQSQKRTHHPVSIYSKIPSTVAPRPNLAAASAVAVPKDSHTKPLRSDSVRRSEGERRSRSREPSRMNAKGNTITYGKPQQ